MTKLKPGQRSKHDIFNSKVDMFKTVKEYHFDGPRSEFEAQLMRNNMKPAKCRAVLKEFGKHSGHTAGEIYFGVTRDRLQFERVENIYDLRRQLYILKKKGMLWQGEVRPCQVLNVNTVTWYITEIGKYYNETQKNQNS